MKFRQEFFLTSVKFFSRSDCATLYFLFVFLKSDVFLTRYYLLDPSAFCTNDVLRNLWNLYLWLGPCCGICYFFSQNRLRSPLFRRITFLWLLITAFRNPGVAAPVKLSQFEGRSCRLNPPLPFCLLWTVFFSYFHDWLPVERFFFAHRSCF